MKEVPVFAVIYLTVLAILCGTLFGTARGEAREREAIRSQAVDVGAATYVCDTHGECEFTWNSGTTP